MISNAWDRGSNPRQFTAVGATYAPGRLGSMARIWDKFLTERDKKVIEAAGYGTRGGYGNRAALLIVDVTYGFTGDRPEPILESIKRWNNSSGEESWEAIAVISKLATAFRAKRMPVIYSVGDSR